MLKALMYLCASISISIFVGIVGYVFYRGLPYVNLKFITSVRSALNGTEGIAGNIVNTLYIVTLTLIIVTPIGIGAAIFLNEYAKPGKLVRLIEFTTET
jgi:phosphate transport system permease protein